MNTRRFRAMNTEWWIGVPHDLDLMPLEAMVHEAERRYSRFRPESLLSRLNRERVVRHAELASIVTRALEMHEATRGAFDVRVGGALHAAGYDRTFEAIAASDRATAPTLAPPVAALRVDVEGDTVRLEGAGSVDLGGIVKGWTVDRVAEAIERRGCTDYVVDGGGDIRAHGRDARGEPWLIGVGDGRGARIEDAAVCTSTTLRRRWPTARGREAHHIIDPAAGAPSQHAIVEAVVVAPCATVADVLATALLAQPDEGLRALPAFEADAMYLRQGAWGMTSGMRRRLV